MYTDLVVARWGDVDDAGSLLALEVCDETGGQVRGLLQHVHVIATTWQRQQHTVFVLQLWDEEVFTQTQNKNIIIQAIKYSCDLHGRWWLFVNTSEGCKCA